MSTTPEQEAAITLEDMIADAIKTYEKKVPGQICIGIAIERHDWGVVDDDPIKFTVDARLIPLSRC